MGLGSAHLLSAPSLSALERRLDGSLYRLLKSLWDRGRRLRARRRWRTLTRRSWFDDADEAAGEPERIVQRLARALREGAFETAIELNERLQHQLDNLDTGFGDRAVALMVETLLIAGERERALKVGQRFFSALNATNDGVALLELLGLGLRRLTLPDGSPNLLALSRQVSKDGLSPDELLHAVGDGYRTWLLNPELHLLFFNALCGPDPVHAARFLERFFSAFGVPGCRWAPGHSASMPAGLAFAKLPSQSGPLVSIVVAARNASRTITGALDSLLGQSHSDIEILVCDDESEDETFDLLEQRYGFESRVRLFRSLRRQGPYNIRNALLERARGDFLTFHDADDIAVPSRIAAQLRSFTGPNIVACVANGLRFDAQGRVVFFKDQKANRLFTVSLMMRRKTWEVIRPFRGVKFGADQEMFEDLRAKFGPSAIARLRSPLVLGQWSPESLTRSAGSESLEDGYRAPLRRLYSELVCLKYTHGRAKHYEALSARLVTEGLVLRSSSVLPYDDRVQR